MKKILFTANTMCFGGIERALVNLLKNIDYTNYEVTLILQKKEGDFLNEIPSQVRVLEYKISESKNIIFRKIYNRLKIMFTSISIKNKYDFSACFATYSIPSSILALNASKNNAIWIHNDYYYMFDQDKVKVDEFFSSINVNKFKRIIFVANESKDNFLKIYPNLKEKVRVCNNLIDYKKINELSGEYVVNRSNKKIFLNVSRHDEGQKKLTRLIEASYILSKENNNFEVLMIGDGPDHEMYESLIKEKGLENIVKLIGKKTNPYPYFKVSDAFVMTSDYEGFPVVYLEACMFLLPVITTIDVTDDYLDIKKFGVLVEKDINEIYCAMKKFIDQGYEYNYSFIPQEFNNNIINKVNSYFLDKD